MRNTWGGVNICGQTGSGKSYSALTIPMRDAKGYLTKEELDRFLSVIDNERDLLLFNIMMKTGRRVSEVVRKLIPFDINWSEKLVTWTILKRKIPMKKTLPVNGDLIERLRDYIRDNNIGDNDYVFKISRQRVFQLVRKYGAKAGVEWIGKKRIHPHHLRHSFAVHMAKNIKNPAELRKLQELMAHSGINITAYYLQFNPTESRELLERTWG